MAQYVFKTTHESTEIAVLLVWERSLQSYFMYIIPGDVGDQHDPRHGNYLYSSLTESTGMFPSMDHYKTVLDKFSIDIPLPIFHELEKDRELNRGHRNVVYWLEDGELYAKENDDVTIVGGNSKKTSADATGCVLNEDGTTKLLQFNGCDCSIEKHTYEANGQISLVLVIADTEENKDQEFFPGEDMAIATTCLTEYAFSQDQTAIKNYGENDGILTLLSKAGLVESLGTTIPSGFVEYPLVRVLI
jgi:hypothetical protein